MQRCSCFSSDVEAPSRLLHEFVVNLCDLRVRTSATRAGNWDSPIAAIVYAVAKHTHSNLVLHSKVTGLNLCTVPVIQDTCKDLVK